MLGSGAGTVNHQAGRAIEVARRLHPPMKCFAREMAVVLGRSSLARQTVYDWESGRRQVPAAALIAAATVACWTVDDLLRLAGSQRGLRIREPATLGGRSRAGAARYREGGPAQN